MEIRLVVYSWNYRVFNMKIMIKIIRAVFVLLVQEIYLLQKIRIFSSE